MKDDERLALERLGEKLVLTAADIWSHLPFDVPRLNSEAEEAIKEAIAKASEDGTVNPYSIPITGEPGAGKTHLLARIRLHVQRSDGFLFYLEPKQPEGFWADVTAAMLQGLSEPHASDLTQLSFLLSGLANAASVPTEVAKTLLMERAPTPELVDRATGLISRHFARSGLNLITRSVLKALMLYWSHDMEHRDIGEAFLLSASELEEGERRAWGIHPDTREPITIAKEISRLLALVGPSVLAVDQVDAIVSQSDVRTHEAGGGAELNSVTRLGDGLMEFWHESTRTVTVLTCFERTWHRLLKDSLGSARDRFGPERSLHPIESAEEAIELVTAYLASRLADVDFEPPHPLWPVDPGCIGEAVGYTPRRLLQRIRDHADGCLRTGRSEPLRSFTEPSKREDSESTPFVSDEPDTSFDALFEQQLGFVDVAPALEHGNDHLEMARLLKAALETWVLEDPQARADYIADPVPAADAAYNALLREVDDATGEERRWYLRSVANRDPRTLNSAIRKLRKATGLSRDNRADHAFLLRAADWELGRSGSRTRVELQRFEDDGGSVVDVGETELRTFAVLAQLLRRYRHDPAFIAWLAERRPAGGTELMKAVFVHPTVPRQREPVEPPPIEPDAERIRIGTVDETGAEVTIPLESLRKHVSVFAGSGSGKTVLLRRFVEECALCGVSSIVLDLNNDLARLGQAWPEAPETWSGDDAERARRYLDETDVVVWTPGVPEGRPLSFPVLPDFAALGDNDTDFEYAVENTMNSLAPRARIDGGSDRHLRARSVLKQALRYFGRHDGTDLDDFLGLLADLPPEAADAAKAETIAAGLAENLKAVRVDDPLFGNTRFQVDIAELLRPRPGYRARVSVVNVAGLASDERRLGFVSQLQMALAAWIKRHPADSPLGSLLVMDEAQELAPSVGTTVCSASTLLLVEQARKFGLGLVFATQAPKNIHNRIVGSTTTQFFGKLKAPAQVEAANMMLKEKDSSDINVAHLGTGEFGAVLEDAPVQKVRSAMCLSHHPRSALAPDEVVSLAKAGGVHARRARNPGPKVS